MKINSIIGIFLLLLASYAYAVSDDLNDLKVIVELKDVSKIEINKVYEKSKRHEVTDKKIISDFLQLLKGCTEMPQIDMRGSHELRFHSGDRTYLIEAFTDVDNTFIRIPEHNGNDLYYRGSKELSSFLNSLGIK